MKRTASTASLSTSPSSSSPGGKRRGDSRMQIEAIAQVALREGLSKEQVAYEQWVDRQPLGAVVGWEEMGDEERRRWCKEVLGRRYGQKRVEEMGVVESMVVEPTNEEEHSEAVGGLGESRWIAVRAVHAVEEKLGSETQVVAELEECPLISTEAEPCPAEETSPSTESSTTTEQQSPKPEPQRTFRHSARVWTATTGEESSLKNKPQCPPCARLKRTWTRCRGGPPCIECQHRGLSAEQCQSYELLNRSRKDRLKKREEVCGETEIEEIGRKESVGGVVMKEEGRGDTRGLEGSGEKGDFGDEEEAQ